MKRSALRRPHGCSLKREGSGIAALLITSMHMTLLGALFALGNRPLFEPAASASGDQQLGGVIMLLVGGASYLSGGLGLTAIAAPIWSKRCGRPPVTRSMTTLCAPSRHSGSALAAAR